ncbi:hypothetical protein Q8A73_005080 [Channa argus]|nr:hypothetical protein Q8A73_005080 [Channa argus]
MKPQAPPGRAAETIFESRSRKPCHCIRSQCLKLYCECFANGVMCSKCNCSNCHNNAKHEMRRRKAIKSCLGRNPDAFRPKIAGGKSGEVKGWHNKGCNCKRSGCLKNYCKCYEANIVCSSNCKCIGCRNYDTNSEKGPREKTGKDKWMVSLITPTVLKAVCSCLMVKAKEAERKGQSKAQAEHMVLDEFGHCCETKVKLPPALEVVYKVNKIIKATAVWTCSLVVSLLVESCHTHKLNIHWGPQSMMYLKGKHGRRFVSEDGDSMLKQGLQGWYAVLRGIQRLQLLEFSKPSHIVSSENVLIHYLQQR